MPIEGPYWFVGALLICGAHVIYLRSWYREYRQRLTWWQKYDADAKQRHDDFMRALGSRFETQVDTQVRIS